MLSKARVLAKIQRLHEEGKPLNISAVKRHWPKLIESVYSRKKYWGWKQALADAGISYEEIEVELAEYEECRLCGNLFRHVGSHLSNAHAVSCDEYLEEFPDAELTSETFRAHFVKPQHSGERSMPHWEPLWTPEYVLDRAFVHFQRGYPVTGCVEFDPNLWVNAVNFFGSWDVVLDRVGVDADLVKSWRSLPRRFKSKKEVVALIQERHLKGLPLNTHALTRGVDREARDHSLLRAGYDYFGSWPKAIKAAGINPKQICQQLKQAKYPTKASVIVEIKRRHEKGLSLTHSALAKGPEKARDSVLVLAGIRHFGNWDSALEKAGFSRESISPPRQPTPPKNPVIHREVEKVKKKLPHIATLSGDERYQAMMALHRKHFWAIKPSKYGSWKALAEALDIPYEKLSVKRYIDEESIFDALQARIRQKKSNQASCVFRDDRPLYKGVLQHFGNFRHPKLKPYLN